MAAEPAFRPSEAPNAQPQTTVAISARVAIALLASAIGFLVLMHAAVQIAWFGFGRDHVLGLTPLFDLNRENNIPAWYSGTVFLITAAALASIAVSKRQAGDRFRRHWAVLAIIFVYLSFDELTRVHENWGNALNAPLAAWRDRAVLGGMLRNLWVLPAGLVATIVGLSYLRFLLHLPFPTRALFVMSGVTFVAAAVGMEMVGAAYSAAGGRYEPAFMVFVTIEEGLEMGSIALFLYSVLRYAADNVGVVHVRFTR